MHPDDDMAAMLEQVRKTRLRVSARRDQIFAEISDPKALAAMERMVKQPDSLDWNDPETRSVAVCLIKCLRSLTYMHLGEADFQQAEILLGKNEDPAG